MPGFRRRDRDELSIEDEREALRRQRDGMTEELQRLKAELAERVAAVREKERRLDEALSKQGAAPATASPPSPAPTAPPGPHPREAEVARRLAELAERERALAGRERALSAREALPQSSPTPTPAVAAVSPSPVVLPAGDQAARVEKRLAELKEAERVFLRTQDELATRSEALAARERLVADRERELDDREDRAGLGPTRSELAELETRLRRLESTGRSPALEDTQTFAGGLETLRRRGTKRPPGR